MELVEKEKVKAPVIVGGVIPAQDIPELKKIGVAEVFIPGTPTSKIISFIKELVGGYNEVSA